jgi:hypothetical protein
VLGVGSAAAFKAMQDTEAAWASGPALLLTQVSLTAATRLSGIAQRSWTVNPP